MNTLHDAIAKFNKPDMKGFMAYDVTKEMSLLSEDIKHTAEYNNEMLAFSLVENSTDNEWGTYYGPVLKGRDEHGAPVYYPPLSAITNEAVLYWESRIPQMYNPLLKMRYCGLVWEFKRKVSSESYPPSLYSDYMETMLEVIDGYYCSHDTQTILVLERASTLAKNNQDWLNKLKRSYLRFDKERATDDKYARLWGALMVFMMNHKNNNLFDSTEEKTIVNTHEARLSRLVQAKDPWAVKEQAMLLADYYKKQNSQADIRRVLYQMERAFREAKSKMTSLQWMGNLSMIYQIFTKYNVKEEYKRLLKEMEECGNLATREMQGHFIPLDYSKEQLDEMVSFLTKGSKDEQVAKFALYFVPDKKSQSDELTRLSAAYPLKYLMHTQIMDEKGRPMSVVGSIDDDFDGQLILHMVNRIKLNGLPMRTAINALKETGALSVENIMGRLKASPVVDEYRMETIKQALELYYSDNYKLACYLLVPQIEAIFRTLLDKSGETVIKSGSQGYTLRTLGDILRDNVIESTFDENITLYFRILLTDQRGLNIRNNLCHATVDDSYFGAFVSDLLLHVLVLLSLIR